MTHLDAIIGPLLLRNNCVIIPSFGGFVANYVSAKIDVKNGLINPPSKALSFNKNLTINDGLIVQALAKEQNISFDQAQAIVSTEIAQIKAELNQGNRVHFHNVGFLYTNEAGKIAFEQDRFFNLLLSSYGLGNVQFIAEEEEEEIAAVTTVTATEEKVETPIITLTNTNIEKVERVEEEVEKEDPALIIQQNKQRNLFGRIAKYAAVAALIPLAFYSFWIPIKTDVLTSGIIFKEDFNPFRKSAEVNYKTEVAETSISEVNIEESFLQKADEKYPSVEVFTYPVDADLHLTVRKDISAETTTSNEVHANVVTGNYHAIVGCFSDAQNANNLIAELNAKGLNAYEVDKKGGLHRISAGNASSNAEIMEIRQQLNGMNLSSWILKK